MLQFKFNDGVDAIQQFLGTNWVDKVKATSVSQGSFNDMEGYQYTITVKVFGKRISPVQRYKGRMFQIVTNSTYLEEILEENSDLLTAFNEYLADIAI